MEINSKDIKMNVLPNELDIKAQEAATAIFEMEQLLANVQDTVNRTEYYWNGEALEAFLGDVESSPLPDIDFEMSLKKQKDNIVAMLINAEANKERLKSMTETLNDMMKESQDIVEDIPETLFILSNETRQFGAICMLYPEVLKKFCVEKMIDNITKNNIISKYCMITESRN